MNSLSGLKDPSLLIEKAKIGFSVFLPGVKRITLFFLGFDQKPRYLDLSTGELERAYAGDIKDVGVWRFKDMKVVSKLKTLIFNQTGVPDPDSILRQLFQVAETAESAVAYETIEGYWEIAYDDVDSHLDTIEELLENREIEERGIPVKNSLAASCRNELQRLYSNLFHLP